MRLSLSNARFQAPLAEARNRVSNIWRWLLHIAGRYRPIPRDEKAITLAETVTFKGDAPQWIEGGAMEQGRLEFCIPRPDFENVDNLVVTPKGAGWKDGVLYQRYCASEPGLRMMLDPHKPEANVDEGYFIQSAHNDTYGDWMSEYLCALARCAPITAPLYLPAEIANRSYVKRDLKTLGIEYVSIDRPTLIRKAVVLRQKKFFVHFPPEEIQQLKRFLNVDPPAARPGSVLYLSRRGERSEVADRVYPHAPVEAVVKARGGRVLLTAEASFDDYRAAAAEAETVIFDHGSAIYNALFWRTRRFIEIASTDWWNNAFLMLANAYGVKDYTIVNGVADGETVSRKIETALAAPIET